MPRLLVLSLIMMMAAYGHAADSPAFTATQLADLPVSDWITNGGNIYNQRYSPLDEINAGNVRALKAEWQTHLNGSGSRTAVFRRGAAHRPRRRDLCAHRRGRCVCNRCGNRQATLGVPGSPGENHLNGVLRLGQPRRRDRRRQNFSGASRRQNRCAGSAHRQGSVVGAGGALAGRLHDHQRAACTSTA